MRPRPTVASVSLAVLAGIILSKGVVLMIQGIFGFGLVYVLLAVAFYSLCLKFRKQPA
jgi:hypothetical protein